MKGWRTATFGEVLQKTESVDPLKSPNDEFDYVDVSSVSNLSHTIEETQRLLGKDAPSRARRLIRTNDVLFATIRPTLSRIAIVPEELDGEVCSTGYFVLRPKEALDHRFVFYFLQADQFMGRIAALQKGASYPAVTDADVRSQLISFPPLPEQHRIVAILDEAFAGIAVAKANAEQNRRNARAVFDGYLHDVFARAWSDHSIAALAELTTDITDGDHMPPPKSSEGVPFITIGDINKETRTVNFGDTFLVSQEYYDGLKPNRKPRVGDVLYTVTGSYGMPVLVTDSRAFCFQRHIGLVRPDADVDSEWLYYLLMSPQVFHQAESGATGTAQKTVSLKTLRSFRVPVMPLDEQQVDAENLRAALTETQHLESLYTRKLAALDELKQSLLHAAFSGAL